MNTRHAFSPLERRAIRDAINEWLRIRERYEHESRFVIDDQGTKAIRLIQLQMDVGHSALLDRLLHGYEPLPEPPELYMAYPKYPDIEEYRSW